jgi:hypothetical protein
MVGYCTGRRRLRMSYHTSFIALWCNNQRDETDGLHKRGKKVQ